MKTMLRFACAAAWVLASAPAVHAAAPGAGPLSSWSGSIPASANGVAAAAAARPAPLSSWSGIVSPGGASRAVEAPSSAPDPKVLSSWSGVIAAPASRPGTGVAR